MSLIPVMLAVVGGFFLSGRTQVVKHVRQPSESEQPDMRVQNLHLIEQAEAGDEWELSAHEAEFYDAKQRVVVHQVTSTTPFEGSSPSTCHSRFRSNR